MNEATEVMHIRIPKDLAAKIREVSKVENAHLGTALKFIIEQATYDKIETRMTKLEEKVSDTHKALLEILPQYRGTISRHCATLNYILGSDHPMAQHLRETMKCKECSFSECPGLVEYTKRED